MVFNRIVSLVLQALLVVVFLVNVAMNVRQRREIARLGKSVQELRQSLAARRLLRGDPLAELEVLDRRSAPRILNARDGVARLMVVVDPGCETCAATASELASVHAPTWVISLAGVDATNKFAGEHHLGDSVFALSPRNYPLLRQKLAGFPQIVRLDGRGLVEKTCGTVRECVVP